MRINLQLDSTKIASFKKVLLHLKKTCPNQTIYITFDNESIKLITEYNSQKLQFIDAFYNFNIDQYVSNTQQQTLESKLDKNLIMLKIKDFNTFANNFNQIQDQATQVNLILSKENDQRFIKIKVQESQALQTISKSEIFLNFNELEFLPIEDQIFQLLIPSKDICKMLDISHKKEQDLFILVEANKDTASLTIQLNNPSITVTYSDLQVKNWLMQNQSTDQYTFVKEYSIAHQHSKQLSQICAIDEDIYFGILNVDQSITIEFQEINNEGTIVGVKNYVIPKIENWDEDQKIEEEDFIKQEDMQQSSVQQQLIDQIDELGQESDDE